MKLKAFAMTISLALFLLAMPPLALAQENGAAHYVYFDTKDRPTLKFTNQAAKNQRCGALVSYTLLDGQEEAIAIRGHHLHFSRLLESPSFPEYGWLYITASRVVFIVINGDKSHSFDIPRTQLTDKPTSKVTGSVPVSVYFARFYGIQINLKEKLLRSNSNGQKFVFHLITQDKRCTLSDWGPYSKFIQSAVKDFDGTLAEFKRVAAELKQAGKFELLAKLPRLVSLVIPDPFSEFGESLMDSAVSEPTLSKIELDPPSPDDPSGRRGIYHATLSMIDTQNGRTGQARTNAEKALQLLNDPSNDSEFFAKGVAHYKLASYDLAIADFDRSIQLNPERGEIYFYRGKTHYDKGDYKRALPDFDKAIQLSPQDPAAYHYRGTLYLNTWKNSQAAADYSAVIRLKPDYRLAYQNRAITYERLGEKLKAMADWAKLAEMENLQGSH
jgi:Tfp pilus assembly protein PilF